MRTTLSLEPDVARLVEDEMHRGRKSMKQVVNEALRRSLAPKGRTSQPRLEIRPHRSALRPGIDPGRLNALVDELDDDEIVRQTQR